MYVFQFIFEVLKQMDSFEYPSLGAILDSINIHLTLKLFQA